MLMEIDGQLLQEIRDQGGTIKGRAEDQAVLCTRTQTFALKHVQTTNTMLLIAPLQESTGRRPTETATVAARSEHHLEAVATAPRLERLSQMLPEYQEENPDGAEAMEEDSATDMEEHRRQNSAAESLPAALQASTTEQLLDRLQVRKSSGQSSRGGKSVEASGCSGTGREMVSVGTGSGCAFAATAVAIVCHKRLAA